ncbi:MAG: hypothetical protein V1495_09615 [Pseudomonadota bacterium]
MRTKIMTKVVKRPVPWAKFVTPGLLVTILLLVGGFYGLGGRNSVMNLQEPEIAPAVLTCEGTNCLDVQTTDGTKLQLRLSSIRSYQRHEDGSVDFWTTLGDFTLPLSEVARLPYEFRRNMEGTDAR